MTDQSIAVTLAPLLNHLLTGPQFQIGGGLDFGWYCREHALVTKFAHEQRGLKCDIVRGHVAAYVSGNKRLTTVGTDGDHVWCVTDEFIPCDLSMTFRHFSGYPQFDSPVLGCKHNGAFAIIYAKDTADFPDALQSNINAVYFAPTVTLNHTVHQYISDPLLLLETKEAWRISLAIAAYIADLTNGTTTHLFHGDTPQHIALQLLLNRYRHPDKHLRRNMR